MNKLFLTLNILLIVLLGILQAKESFYSTQSHPFLNIINGVSTECVMHKFYTSSGWTRIDGEVGRNGIDGLYYKKKDHIIKEVLVAESKWNTSRLGLSGKGKTVKQMSQEWVLRTLRRLQKYKPIPEYASILKLVKNGQYRARLFRMKPVGENGIQIIIYKIRNKGAKAFDKIMETKLHPININAPRNSFERGIIKTYNDCRKKYLHRYLPGISKSGIDRLMRDNYLQPGDICNVCQ